MPPEFAARVTLKASVAESEDRDKVIAALHNVLGDVTQVVSEHGATVRVETADQGGLDRMRDQLRDRHVRGAARRRLLKGTSGRRTIVLLNKQAAAAGVIALCDDERESPLGPITLTIESDELERVIDWLAEPQQG